MLSSFPARMILCAAFLAGMVGVAQAADRSVAIDGEASTTYTPDFAILTIGVNTTAESAADAIAGNTKAANDVMLTLKEEGIEVKDVTTLNFSVRAKGKSDGSFYSKSPDAEGYSVVNTLNVPLHDLTRLGEILDKTSKAGATTVSVQFGLSNQASLLDETRKAAYLDARHKATVYASASGLRLGKLISIQDTTGPINNSVVYAGSKKWASQEIGQNTLTVTIAARFEIEDFPYQ